MYLLRQYTDLIPFVQLRIPQIDIRETIRFALGSGVLFVLVGFAHNVYWLFRPAQHSLLRFFRSRVVRVMISGFVARIGFGYVFTSGISRFVLIFASLLSLFLITMSDILQNLLVRQSQRRAPYRLLIVSHTQQQLDMLAEELQRIDEYQVDASLFAVLDPEAFVSYDACLLVWTYDTQRLQQRADQRRIAGKELYHLPEGHFLEDILARPVRLGSILVMGYISSPLSGRRRVVKRGVDILGSTIGLIILSPIFLVVAILIKLNSPGPVMYRQMRIGKGKQPFRFLKFRSMYTHLSLGAGYGGKEAEQLYAQLIQSDQNVRKGILPKIANDPRVTRVGARLRKTSLDELPSLRSVLIGDMSLIWPRPHLPREVEQYADRHERLFTVKPGITGYAQLYGRDKVPFDEEAKLDLRYIQHRSLRLDIYVLVGTIKVIFGWK